MAVPPAFLEAMKAATLQPAIAEAMKAVTGLPPGVAEAMKAATMPPAIADILKLGAMPPGFSNLWGRVLERWQEFDPPNWPAEVAWDDMRDLTIDTGWSLIHVPRAQIILELLSADPADRSTVLLSHAIEVVADCRTCLQEMNAGEHNHLVGAVDQALDAFDAGLLIPAQATVASVLTDVINRVFGLTLAAAIREWDKDPEDMPMLYLRFWLIASTIPRALSKYHCNAGDEVPEQFNRHAVAHTVDPRQYTKLNALVGLMLATGLIRELVDGCQ